MKTTFFAAALVALATTANGVSLYSAEDFDYDFAELDSNTDAVLECDGDAAADVITDAECEQMVGGVVIRLQTPECQKKEAPKCPPPTFEAAMLSALDELSKKAVDLGDALKMQFAKSQQLASSKTLSISGNLAFTPVVPAEPAPKPCPCPEKKPDQVITLKADAPPACDACKPACDSCPAAPKPAAAAPKPAAAPAPKPAAAPAPAAKGTVAAPK